MTGELPQLVQGGELSVQHGIPSEAFDLECPDAGFKAAVLQEFILLDGKFVERLDKLEDEHYLAIRLVRFDLLRKRKRRKMYCQPDNSKYLTIYVALL